MQRTYILITRPGKIPVLKRPGVGSLLTVAMLDECLEREEADGEIRTVCLVNEYGDLEVVAEREYRDLHKR